jgi:hypothetical protein
VRRMGDKTYNRIEEARRVVDDIIARCGPPPLERDYATVECILERRRPDKCLPRSESVNMREDRDFSMMGIDAFDSGYIHQLKPLGTVEERDVKWIGALQVRHPKPNIRINCPDKYEGVSDNDLADWYWCGKLSDIPSVEYVTEKARVVSVDEHPSPVHPSKLDEALKQVSAYDQKIFNS